MTGVQTCALPICTYVLLQAAREHQPQVRHFHHISTDEVFGTLGATGFFTEDTPYAPHSP